MNAAYNNLESSIEKVRTHSIIDLRRELNDRVACAFSLDPNAEFVSVEIFGEKPYLRAIAEELNGPHSLYGELSHTGRGYYEQQTPAKWGPYGRFRIFRTPELYIEYKEKQAKEKKRQDRINAREARRSEKRKIRNGRLLRVGFIGGTIAIGQLAHLYLPMGSYLSAALTFCRAVLFLP